ncbi:ABC transporter ATP-binding protein [Pseudaminobacter arsenicus]|uniref:ABC transporter ATP-binding protein n=1 Tax=Borborobacter arsenicus TaxID=1851146 RepID=A0A432VAJ0_9HYPH|nr:ABC transporter ATP-binding protein [Pseudaminobacter arsenicus]RUM99211.1 ABC transporter ATP-binding protein [Pseudaminobacter arsenicus]
MLEVDNIECRYGKINVLHGVSLNVGQGEFVTLIGANGAGKSTTLKAISGLLSPVAGRITFEGEDITKASPRRILEMGIAHCPEGRRVFPYMTVQENLELGCYLRRDWKQMARDLDSVFDRFPVLGERRDQAAGTLSGGEQQMLAIGRALMSRPKLVLFDEPSLGLAPNNVQKTFEYIMEINRQGTTVLMVEQNAYAALEMCDRSFLLESGCVTLEGKGEDMIHNPHIQSAYLGMEA